MTRWITLLFVGLLTAVGMAQERPMAVSTLTTTDTSTASVCVGCVVGTSTPGGGLIAQTLAVTTSVAGAQNVIVTNSTSSTTTQSKLTLVSGTTTSVLSSTSQAFTTSGPYKQAATFLDGGGAGGISISASNAAGVIGFYTGGTTLRWGVNAAGDFVYGTSSHIAFSNGTPSASANGCSGAGCTLAYTSGTDSAMLLTASGPSNSVNGTVTFGHTFSAAPACARPNSSNNDAIYLSSLTTTGFTITGTMTSGSIVTIACIGY